jgi:FixJ family two-component response regulator
MTKIDRSARRMPSMIKNDDEAIREAIQSLIRLVGQRGKTFASAEEYLRSGHNQETRCLILDVQMPGMSGLERARR